MASAKANHKVRYREGNKKPEAKEAVREKKQLTSKNGCNTLTQSFP